MSFLEQSYRANPPIFTIAKGGLMHVFPGGDLPRGGIAKSLCNTRPPIFNGDPTEMFEIRPSLWHPEEEVAPGHWERLMRIQQSVSCGVCKANLKELINGVWTAFDLMEYTNGYGCDEGDVRLLIASIPLGHWAGQGDIAAACGGRPGSGFAVRYLLNVDKPFAQRYGHRVLYDDGSGADVEALRDEGIIVDVDTRHPADAQRLGVDELTALKARAS